MRAAWIVAGLLSLAGCRHEGNGSDGQAELMDQSATFSGFDLGGDAGEITSGGLVVSPAAVHFGHVAVGKSAMAVVNLANLGGSALTVDGVAVNGPGFSVDSSNVPLALGPGATGAITVTFAPTTDGMATGSLSISSTTATAPVVVALDGHTGHEHDVHRHHRAGVHGLLLRDDLRRRAGQRERVLEPVRGRHPLRLSHSSSPGPAFRA